MDFTVPLKDLTVPEKSTATFTCNLNLDTDDVQWFLDADKLLPSPTDGVDIKKDGLKLSLAMQDVTPEDSGVIKVTANRHGFTKTTEAKLKVLEGAAKFTSGPKDLTVKEKETAEFTCVLDKDVDTVQSYLDILRSFVLTLIHILLFK